MKKIMNITAFILSLAVAACSGTLKNDNYVPEDSMPGGGKFEQGPSDPGHKEGQWTVYELDEGLRYYNFEDWDNVSGAYQIVNVVSVDLENPAWSVKFSYMEGGLPTSSVFLGKNAVACINAAYEASSVFIKVNGTAYAEIANDIISGTDVPQWKNEGAVYTDGGQDVRVEYTAKGLDLEATRAVYSAATEQNILTSAPMLIDDYEKVGSTFIERQPGYYEGINLNSLNYENPIRHQGVRHPRTAVAVTEDNHFLMITVDGRWPGKAEGMSAKELTEFIALHFNPEYALNMDGGGSTTMCVSGYGESGTNVVNYPTDNGIFDHTGERRVTTHIYVVGSEN